jgi:putative component of toxin-antitoxin plasmid stabilization module
MVCGVGAGGKRQDYACHCPHGARQFLNAKGVGEGVLEYKIDFGPGYRVYFGRDGDTIVILLTGGTKKRQQRDIDAAKAYWRDYKLSKRGRR